MSEVMTKPEPTHQTPSATNTPAVEVFAVYGVEPEVQAYAMAKYSRSALSMKESLKEITAQKAEKFLNTFYFQYGHRSIADLAHIALAIEKLSILAAIAVADEQRWDGQERSTRYQDFKKSGYYVPDFGGDDQAQGLYRNTMDGLFEVYEALSQRTYEYLAEITPRPEDMKPDAYERTLRARAFDISRYLLPLGTNTSLGEIVNARTLETQVAHLLSQPHAEIRNLGELLKKAALSPAYNVNQEALEDLVSEIREVSPELALKAEEQLLKEVRVAPTLVKYANPNPYEIETRRALQQAAIEMIGRTQIAPTKLVDLLDEEPLEVELASTLLYEHCHYSYRQVRQAVQAARSRLARRATAPLLRRTAVPLRHPDGHRRLPRPAPPSPLRPDRPGLHHPPRLRHAARNRRRRCPRRLRCRDEKRRARRRSDRSSPRRRNRGERAVCHPTRLPQAHTLQNGLRRGRVHLRTENRARRTHVLPQRGVRDV